jgi:hypothetical protein
MIFSTKNTERKKKPAPVPPTIKRIKPVPSPRTVQEIELKTPTISEAAEEIEQHSPKKGNQHRWKTKRIH